MPYIRATQNWASNETRTRGHVTSIGGRIHHKPKPFYDPERGKWNDGLYKMLNYLIQGSCADTLKQGLIDAYRAGTLNVLKLHATVHDENVLSIPYTKEGIEAAVEFQNEMESAFIDRWTVPIRTSGDVGSNWGLGAVDGLWEEMKSGNFDFNKYKELVV
jgi:DNA polymerase I-like protein with 3'-5' exonuclease and polymerase domains